MGQFENSRVFFLKYKFQLYLTAIFLIGFLFICLYLFDPQIPFTNKKLEELGNKNKPFYIRNIIIALAAFATAIFTWWKNVLNSKHIEVLQKQTEAMQIQATNTSKQLEKFEAQIRIQEETRLDTLFSKAVDLLKQENDLIIRQSSIYILKDLALSSPKHTQKCIDTLCSINELWMPWMLEVYPDFFEIHNDFRYIKNFEKLFIKNLTSDNRYILKQSFDNMKLSQLVLKTMSQIIKVIYNDHYFSGPFNLSHKYLCNIELSEIDFEKFALNNINLNGSTLFGINFYQCKMWESDIRNSKIIKTSFKDAFLQYSKFDSTILNEVSFENADIDNCSFIGASFIKTDIQSIKK